MHDTDMTQLQDDLKGLKDDIDLVRIEVNGMFERFERLKETMDEVIRSAEALLRAHPGRKHL